MCDRGIGIVSYLCKGEERRVTSQRLLIWMSEFYDESRFTLIDPRLHGRNMGLIDTKYQRFQVKAVCNESTVV